MSGNLCPSVYVAKMPAAAEKNTSFLGWVRKLFRH